MAVSCLRPLLLALALLLLRSTNSAAAAAPYGCFSSIFSFGDSLTDTGNFLISSGNDPVPAGQPPYGETFFHHPFGRLSDGRLIIDFLAFGLPYLRPYLAGIDSREDFRHGANFAVAGATALDNDFYSSMGLEVSWTDYSLEAQLRWFRKLLPSLCSSVAECEHLMSDSLFLVGEIGGNDYFHSFLQGQSVGEVKAFVPDVVDAISSAINELIDVGAKTLVVPGIIPLGCVPVLLDQFQGGSRDDYDPQTGCLKLFNHFVAYHNSVLRQEVNRLRLRNPQATIIYFDHYSAAISVYRDPQAYGFKGNPLVACCGGGGPYNYNASAVCGEEAATTTVCGDPWRHVNWDGTHFTEAAHEGFARGFLGQFTVPSISQICPQANLHAPF